MDPPFPLRKPRLDECLDPQDAPWIHEILCQFQPIEQTRIHLYILPSASLRVLCIVTILFMLGSGPEDVNGYVYLMWNLA